MDAEFGPYLQLPEHSQKLGRTYPPDQVTANTPN